MVMRISRISEFYMTKCLESLVLLLSTIWSRRLSICLKILWRSPSTEQLTGPMQRRSDVWDRGGSVRRRKFERFLSASRKDYRKPFPTFVLIFKSIPTSRKWVYVEFAAKTKCCSLGISYRRTAHAPDR